MSEGIVNGRPVLMAEPGCTPPQKVNIFKKKTNLNCSTKLSSTYFHANLKRKGYDSWLYIDHYNFFVSQDIFSEQYVMSVYQ